MSRCLRSPEGVPREVVVIMVVEVVEVVLPWRVFHLLLRPAQLR